MKVAVLGGGHGSYAAAAEMTEKGHDVWFWRRDAAAFQSFLNHGTMKVTDSAGRRTVRVSHPTLSLAEAVDGAKVVLAPLPANAQADFASVLAPHLQSGQIVFIPPGSIGSLLFSRAMHKVGNTAEVVFAETGTLPYLVRKHGPSAVTVSAYAKHLPTGFFPAHRTEYAAAILAELYPSIRPIEDVMSAALMNAGPVIHPPLIVMNAGPLEHFDAWDIHNEGTQPSIRAVTDALDNERMALREALGYGAPHFPLADHYSKGGTEWMYGHAAHEKLTDSGDWRERIDLHSHRYMREDLALGLSFLVSVARWRGAVVPVAEGLLSLGSAIVGETLYARSDRTLEALGLDALSPSAMASFLASGTLP